MNKELTPQKERFLREVEQQLLRRDLDARPLEDGLIHIKWNEKPLCSVDRDGIVRFRPADITGSEVDRKLRTVTQVAAQVKEYMQIFDRAPALKAVGLDDTYKVLADFGDAVLAGRSCKTGAKFVTWEWDFDRQGVHAGHYFMENYEAAKQDFAVRAGLVESQRLFSDEQLAVIRNACAFALEDDATLSYAEEKQLQSVQEQIELLLPQQEVQIEADVMYLKRVLDNLFDNIRKYADPAKPVAIAALIEDGALHICLSNSVNPASGRIESNKIGLRTCAKIMAQMAGGFKRYTENGKFTAEVILPIQAETMPSE